MQPRLHDMKTGLWQFVIIVLLVACNSRQKPSEDPADNLGINNASERLAANESMLAEAKKTVQNGDLILRTGTDFSSEQVKYFSRKDQTYSHGGIAFREGDDVFVYHVVPDFFHIKDKVQKEKLDSFANPAKNLGFGIARYKMDSTEIASFQKYLDRQFQDKIPFDMTFHLTTDDSMYCSEMIKKGLILATKGRITLENEKFDDPSKFRVITQHLKLPVKSFAGRDFVPIDHLFLHPECQMLKRYVYE